MSDDYIKKALHEAVKQLVELHDQRMELKKRETELERQTFKLLPKIHSLAALCDDIPADSAVARVIRGIEKASLRVSIRNILSGTGEWMSTRDLRDYLIRFRIDLTRYRNPLGSIHTILGRFVESGDVEQKIDPKTKKAVFRWKPPSFMDDRDTSRPEEVAAIMLESEKKRRKSKAETPTPAPKQTKQLVGKDSGKTDVVLTDPPHKPDKVRSEKSVTEGKKKE